MKEITVDTNLVAYCGLYCGACGRYLKGSCLGCHENAKAGWCKVRSCCIEREYSSCADCKDLSDPNQCDKFNNIFAKVFALIFNSNRQACVLKIRELGLEGYTAHMAGLKRQSLPRKGG
jgi:hypothetical protein